ncbi:MAG: S8 family serine peptidase, partial [Candidatus Omnitrophota bacterium]|nr:S8 family serine peptidase [Candidatus Omnitrophota bacterium]
MYTSRQPFNSIRVPALAAVLIWVASVIMQPISTYASQNISDTLQKDGKVRLIIKFDDIAAGKIAYKLAGRGEVIDNNLNEYILKKIDEKYNLTKLKKLFADKELARTEGGFAREFANYYIIEVDRDEKYADEICAALQWLSDIDMIEPDLKVNIEATRLPSVSYIPNDYYVTSDNVYWREGTAGSGFPDLWGLQKTQAFEAWDLFGNARTDPGKDIVVAVIDTGVDFSHPDVGGNKWVNPDETAGNGVDDDGNGYVDDINGWDFVSNDNNPYDGHGHGTHVSGTIAAVTNNSAGIAGVAPNAKIMAVKGLSDSGSGYISDLANCLIYAANNGADVLSNSWGGSGSSSTLENAVNYAYSKGCVVVAAAGNSNADAAGYTPAGYANVITVAATDRNDVKASFSNYGSIVDVSAPGVSVLSSSGGTYKSWSGTSMACPHVSGLAALILSQDPTLTNAEVAQRIKDTADNIYGQNPSWQGKLGTGRINAYKAILAGGPQKHAPVLDPIGNKAANEGELLSFTVSATDADGDPLIYSIVDLPGGLEKSGDANFFVETDVFYEGTKALQSGAISKNQSSSVSKAVTLSVSGTVSFYWKVSSGQNSGALAFYVDSVKQAEISGEVSWQNKTFSLSAGAHTLKWTYYKNNANPAGTDAGWIDKIVISSGSSDSYDFENSQMPSGFTTGGHGRFYVTSGTVHQGTYAIMADPVIGDNQYEYVQKTVQTAASAQLSFWWKVSSEYYYDFLEFYIDGVLQDDISGDTTWQKKTYTLSSGTHTLKWQYWKDYSVTTGQDTGWVDDILVDGRSEEAIDFEPVAGQPNPLPRGASFDVSTHRFTWTPDYSQSGSYPGIRFIVTEDTAEKRSDYEDIAITVNNVSKPPVLDPIGNKAVSEMELLSFTISASDPEGDALTYSASSLPTGASFNAATRTFSWAPTYQQSGIYSKVRFEVTDGTGGGSGGGDTNTKLLMHLNSETGFTDTSASPHAVTKY